MSKSVTSHLRCYQEIFNSFLYEYLNNDTNPYYRWLGVNNMYLFLEDAIEYFSLPISLIRKWQINCLIEEFLDLYDNDPVFASFYKKHTIQLVSELKGLVKNDKDVPSYKIRDLFLVLKSEISGSYIRNLTKYINQYINNRNYDPSRTEWSPNQVKKFKRSIVYMLDILQISKWYSRRFLNFQRDNLLDHKLPNENEYSIGSYNFVQLLMQNPRQYRITFKIRIWRQANKVKISLKDFVDNCPNWEWYFSENFDTYDSSLIKEEMRGKFDSFVKVANDGWPETCFFARIDGIFGLDDYSIWRKAKTQLLELIDIFRYEFNAASISIVPAYVTKTQNSKWEDRMFYVDDEKTDFFNRKKWKIDNVANIFKMFNGEDIHQESLQILKNSLKYYHLSANEKYLEWKILNLWIALESLFAHWLDGDIGFSKLENFSPVLYNFNIIKEYFDEVQDFILSKVEIEKQKWLPYCNYTQIKRDIENKNLVYDQNQWGKIPKFNNIACMLWVQSDDLSKITNEYYRQKYLRLKSLILKDKSWNYSELPRFFGKNASKIKRLINKIYRYRNYIVHWGKSIESNARIYADLEFIYITIMDDIFEKFTSDNYQIHSLDAYFSRIKRSYDFYARQINPQNTEFSASNQDLVLPRIVY